MKSSQKLSIVVLSLLFILLAIPLSAQKRGFKYKSSKEFSYGLNAGTTFSNLMPDNNPSTQYKTGYYFGGFFEYSLPKDFGIQADINFRATGGESVPASILFNPSSSFLSNVTSIDLMMYGVEVPVYLKYNFTSLFPEISLGVGVCGTYNLKSQAALFMMQNSSNVYYTTTTYVDVTSKVQQIAGSALINAGAKIPIGRMDILVKAEFQVAINDLSGNNEVAYNGFRSKIFKIGLGIGF